MSDHIAKVKVSRHVCSKCSSMHFYYRKSRACIMKGCIEQFLCLRALSTVLPNLEESAMGSDGMQDFFQKDCWKHHPKPHADFMEMKQKEDQELAASRKKLIPGLA